MEDGLQPCHSHLRYELLITLLLLHVFIFLKYAHNNERCILNMMMVMMWLLLHELFDKLDLMF